MLTAVDGGTSIPGPSSGQPASSWVEVDHDIMQAGDCICDICTVCILYVYCKYIVCNLYVICM